MLIPAIFAVRSILQTVSKHEKWQILPLYWYRSVLYGLKMLRYQDFRKYVGEYVKRTGLELKKIL